MLFSCRFLVAVTEKLFPPQYYRNGLSGLLADQYVLQHLLAQCLPRFSEHIAKFPDVDIAAVTTGWFLGLFFDCLPFQVVFGSIDVVVSGFLNLLDDCAKQSRVNACA